jgi:hypothetical protein
LVSAVIEPSTILLDLALNVGDDSAPRRLTRDAVVLARPRSRQVAFGLIW